VALDTLFNTDTPQLDRNLVGNQFAPTGVLKELLAQRGTEIKGPKNISTGAMKIARNDTKGPSLGSFATAWGTKD
jgi:hypothetical protein